MLGLSSTSCAAGCARSWTTARRRRTSPSSPSASPAIRGFASRRSRPSSRRHACSPRSGSRACRGTSSSPVRPGRRSSAPAEVIWRFAQHSVHRVGAFNGDPHPGNYRFHHDGSVTFLDFGLVKRWAAGRVAAPRADARCDRRRPRSGPLVVGDGGRRVPRARPRADPSGSTSTCRRRTGPTSSTSSRSRGLDARDARADRRHRRPARRRDRQAEHAARASSFSTGSCGASARSSASSRRPARGGQMLLEYRTGAAPATELGAAELSWRS